MMVEGEIHHPLDLPAEVGLLGEHGVHEIAKRRLLAIEHLPIEVGFRPKMVIDARHPDLRRASDVAHRGEAVTILGKEASGHADHSLAGRRIHLSFTLPHPTERSFGARYGRPAAMSTR